MKRNILSLLAGAAALLSVACSEPLANSRSTTAQSDLAPAFSSLPTGYNEVLNSFPGGPESPTVFFAPRIDPGRGHSGDKGSGNALMGGGLGDMFVGAGFVGDKGRRMQRGLGMGFGCGFGHWPFGDGFLDGNCAFNASSGRVVCEAVTRSGLTINRSVAYTTANGTVQSAFDSITTNTINTRIEVSGTTNRHGSGSTTVQSSSDRTVSGLAQGSTQRTVNGTSAARESSTGSNDKGDFTALRLAGDTTRNVIIPVGADSIRFPSAGTITRAMQVTVTYTGQAPTTSTRREVITYNGSNTATVVITKNGETKTCTLPLPRGRLSCPE